MRVLSRVAALIVILGGPAELAAQEVAEQIREAVEAQRARDPTTALRYLEAALQGDSTSYEANWRTAEVLMDIGKQTPDSVKSAERDSIYARAEHFGRRAVELDPAGADGHYALATAIGRASLTKSKSERVRRAGEVRAEALHALELDPNHAKTYHVLGRWNAEIMRLSGFQRFIARNFMGGKIFNAAAWDSAMVYMEKAVALDPENIYNHLDLAEIFIDRGRYSEARIHLNQVENLAISDVGDPAYQARAAALLKRIADKKDKGS
jgi:tetratricopeptide (TPR) repeat protein